MNPLEYIYFAGYRVKSRGDLKRIRRLPLPVISVGNITTGGTGKTPAVIAIAKESRKRDLNPCILTRGYGGKLKGPLFVSEENYARDVGDEPLLIASSLRDVPVIKCPDRYEGGMFALDNLEDKPDIFILDDGFQHRKLHRDMDVVLVSGTDPFGGERLLPVGRLREPLAGLSRAGAFIITKTVHGNVDDKGRIEETLREHNQHAPVFTSVHEPSGVRLGVTRHMTAGKRDEGFETLDWLRGRKVYALCAIADPGSFVRSLEQSGAIVAGKSFFRDHHKFSAIDMRTVSNSARSLGVSWILTTEKDIMRLRALKDAPENCASLSIDFRVRHGFYDHIFEIARGLDA